MRRYLKPAHGCAGAAALLAATWLAGCEGPRIVRVQIDRQTESLSAFCIRPVFSSSGSLGTTTLGRFIEVGDRTEVLILISSPEPGLLQLFALSCPPVTCSAVTGSERATISDGDLPTMVLSVSAVQSPTCP